MAVERWFDEPSPAEHRVLSWALPPVLDVGCGPARHTLALQRRGVPALGIDVSPGAVLMAVERGASVVQVSVFEDLPEEGSWGSALLLDGNIGIGGDPAGLLARLRRALRPGGRVLVEAGPPGSPTESFRARVEGAGRGSWFPWATVGADALGAVAAGGGLRLTELWTEEERWFAALET
jgi:SAM-dependent methyltransferase